MCHWMGILWLLLLIVPSSYNQPRIVGGFPANIVNFPYIVSIQWHDIHHCGGSIINNRTILTAAHCLEGAKRNELKVKVGGTSRSSKDGRIFAVAAIHSHKNYSSMTMDYDVGIVRLAKVLKYSNRVRAIRIGSTKVADGTYASIAGWGFTTISGATTDILRFARIPIANQTVCKDLLGSKRITNRMICAGYLKGGVDACQMDSGGPLVVNKTLHGIVSWGIGCALPNKPGVYASVQNLRPWVRNQMLKRYGEKV